MRLKKIEISGFKSFANKTALEFPVTISAIVGPNGSGKSNVVDAMRWVLGEQSLKNLRSKSGVDLIWAGSQMKPAQGKAGVSLHFDNRDGFFPIDFEEVVIGRKIYRDGLSEYYLCGSQVRLKDIAELLARSKMGLRGHSIVNQGSADEILKANPDERRGILEEALGLREFQLKKSEAETKLEETGQNLGETQGLLNEILPHLKSLKRQVKKWEEREFLISDLNNLESDYFKLKIKRILSERGKNQKAKAELSAPIAMARENFEAKEKIFESRMTSVLAAGEKTKPFEINLERLNAERHNITKGLGRLEGLIESTRKNNSKNIKTVEAVLAIKVKYWGKRLGALAELSDLNAIKEVIITLAEEIRTISSYFESNNTDGILAMVDLAATYNNEQSAFEKEKEELRLKTAQLESEMKAARDSISAVRCEENKWRTDYLDLQKDLELARREYIGMAEAAASFDLEEEKIKIREADIKSEMWGSRHDYGEFFKTHFAPAAGPVIIEAVLENGADVLNIAELQNKIIKLRREISDIGSVDGETMREYEETGKRHQFLTTEFADLTGAVGSLKSLIGDLSGKINADFKTGLVKINDEFNNYFRLMFGGGSARLVAETLGDGTSGVSVSVNVPQKRIRDLNLLSGGERSLVSIGLLFAIVAASKPPFLVLDEIDAALDENNAVRFAKVLKDLARDTQFVLITHNRATMEAAEVLYGITMGSDGVSKLFSLKLTDQMPS